MDKFIEKIINSISNICYTQSIVVNPDGFLLRTDTRDALWEAANIMIVPVKTSMELRIHFETKGKKSDDKICYVFKSNEIILPDIKKQVFVAQNFNLAKLLPAFNEITLRNYKNLTFLMAEHLFNRSFTSNLSAVETTQILKEAEDKYGIDEKYISKKLENIELDWDNVNTIEEISDLILKAIRHDFYDKISDSILKVNRSFQEFVDTRYSMAITSSAVQKPRVVNRILPFLENKHTREDKVALIVIDGMSFWQFRILELELNALGIKTENDFTFSWIPSITKLSRQAIFRGEPPKFSYEQNPSSERSLWIKYWESEERSARKRFLRNEIQYCHNEFEFDNNQILRYAYVDVDLDSKMHSSSDNKDLYLLSHNWAKKTAVKIKNIYDQDYFIYLTTDHGNILASPWRSLSTKESTYLYKKESRGSRHLIYSKSEFLNQFLINNESIKKELYIKDTWAVWRNTQCFNNKAEVTHGGSHFLEVVIPFISIKKK